MKKFKNLGDKTSKIEILIMKKLHVFVYGLCSVQQSGFRGVSEVSRNYSTSNRNTLIEHSITAVTK